MPLRAYTKLCFDLSRTQTHKFLPDYRYGHRRHAQEHTFSTPWNAQACHAISQCLKTNNCYPPDELVGAAQGQKTFWARSSRERHMHKTDTVFDGAHMARSRCPRMWWSCTGMCANLKRVRRAALHARRKRIASGCFAGQVHGRSVSKWIRVKGRPRCTWADGHARGLGRC